MARKTLDTSAIANELQHSAFFPGSATPAAKTASNPTTGSGQSAISSLTMSEQNPLLPKLHKPYAASVQTATTEHTLEVDDSASTASTDVGQLPQSLKQPLPTDAQPTPTVSGTGQTSIQASSDASPHASDPASMLAPMTVAPGIEDSGLIEAIRKAVRHVGKEVSFVRLTPDEKRQLTEIAYTYKSQGLKTSENEISRIGINWMLEDYHANGQQSVLAQVLAALDA